MPVFQGIEWPFGTLCLVCDPIAAVLVLVPNEYPSFVICPIILVVTSHWISSTLLCSSSWCARSCGAQHAHRRMASGPGRILLVDTILTYPNVDLRRHLPGFRYCRLASLLSFCRLWPGELEWPYCFCFGILSLSDRRYNYLLVREGSSKQAEDRNVVSVKWAARCLI